MEDPNNETITKAEEKILKKYISLYCGKEEHIEAIFNELVGGGHKSAQDPFVKYITPILATRIVLEEVLDQLEQIKESLKFLNFKRIENEQEKILNKLENLEKLVVQEKIKTTMDNKADRVLSIIVTIIVSGISGILLFSIWLQFQKLSEQNLPRQRPKQSYENHHKIVHRTFHKFGNQYVQA